MESKERAARPPTIVGLPSPMIPPNGESGLGQTSDGDRDSTPDWSPDTVLWRSLPNSVVDNRSSRSSSGIPTSLTDSTIDEDSVGAAKSLMASSLYSSASSSLRLNPQLVNTRVEMVYSLLSTLASEDRDDVSATLESMTTSKESCLAMRQSGCIPLLVQLLHGLTDEHGNPKGRLRTRESRVRAAKALHNIVHALPDDKRSRREARVVKLLEQVREFCDALEEGNQESHEDENQELEHPTSAVAALMKLSFDEEHRHAICQLGGLQAIAELLHCDFAAHGHNRESCLLIRRYSGMALTNLTFGDGNNKAALCSMRSFMTSLVAQLDSRFDDLKQVTASVLRNLSWRADSMSRISLRESGSVISLTKCMMTMEKEGTLKSVLSALWNLSAHCTENKVQICSVDGALGFLVGTLTYRSQGKTLSIVENGGGILRNVSSYVATQDEYRAILRRHSCLEILLQQLKSPSLTVVSNACGTLWNLSARCPQDQKRLWELGAVGMLRNLVNSKHKMISMGSSAALKNLLTAQHLSDSLECGGLESRLSSLVSEDLSLRSSETSSLRSCDTPVLLARKAKNLKQQYITGENAKNLSELCDNIEASPKASPVSEKRSLFFPTLPGRMHYSVGEHVPRSASRDSLRSTYSEPGYVRPRPHSLGQLRHSSIDRYSHIDWSTTSAFLASSEGTRAASARRRPASSSCVRPTSTYASFISTSIFEDKEESSPNSSKQGTPHREPRKPTKESGSKDVKPKKDATEKKLSIEKRSAVSSSMNGSMTDSQSSGSSPLKRSRIPQVKRPTESPPPPPTNKKKSTATENQVAGTSSMEVQSSVAPIENRTLNSPMGTPSSESEGVFPTAEKPPTVAVRNVKPIPTPPPSSPNFSSKRSSGNNNDSDKNSSSISEKSPPPSPRKSLTNKHLRAIDIEDDSSTASDLVGVQPPSFFNDLGSMASSCGSLELTADRSPAKKLSLQAHQCWNADEWSPKSCENLDNVMPPSGLNSVECLSLGSSMNSDMLLNANPPSFMEDHSFDDRTHDVIAAEGTYTRDIVNHNEAPIYPRVNTATYTQQHPQFANNKPTNNCIAQLLDDPTEIGSDAFLSDVEGEDLPYDSSTEYYTCRQSTETLRASHFMSCNSGHTRDATVGSSENLTSLDNTLTFDVSGGKKNQNHNSCADLTYDATLVYEPADDECSVVSSVDDATYDISSPRPQTPTRGARIVKPVMINGVAVMPGSPAKPPVVIITGKNSAKNSPKKVPSVPIRQTRASALRASRAQTPAELERSTSRSASSSPARSPPVSARLSSPANRRPLPRTASSPTSRTPIGGKAPQVASPLASRSSSLNSRVASSDNLRPTAGSKAQNENLPPKPALTKEGTFTKDPGELTRKPAPTVPAVPARTTVPNNVVQNNQTKTNANTTVRAPMHKSSSVSHNMTRSTHPTLNRAQSDAAQMSKSVVQQATQRVPLAMRTTAASRARAAAIAHAKAQPSQARVVLTRRATTSGDHRPTPNSVNNNLNNNNNYENDDIAVNRNNGVLQVNDSSALIRSGTYEKINEVGLTPYADSNDNEKIRAMTTQAVRPSEFWTSAKTTSAPQNTQKTGFLKRSVGGNRKVGDSSPVAAPRTIPGLRSPSEVTKLVGSSISNIASPAAVIAPFSYRPRSTPTTPNGSKIPMMRSDDKKTSNAADDEGYVVATARLVTTV